VYSTNIYILLERWKQEPLYLLLDVIDIHSRTGIMCYTYTYTIGKFNTIVIIIKLYCLHFTLCVCLNVIVCVCLNVVVCDSVYVYVSVCVSLNVIVCVCV
jgi:hypothetical protein